MKDIYLEWTIYVLASSKPMFSCIYTSTKAIIGNSADHEFILHRELQRRLYSLKN